MSGVDTSVIESIVETLKNETSQVETFSDVKQIDADDERLNYCFMKQSDIENKVYLKKEWLDTSQIDYGLVMSEGDKDDNYTVGMGKLDKTMPASYFSIKTVEEGTEWFLRKNPELPDGVAEILARYTWGTKQEEKKESTKSKKKKTNQSDGLEVRHGKFMVEFS